MVSVRLEVSRKSASILRTGQKSITFTDSQNIQHLFDYFDSVTEVDSLCETSNSLVLVDRVVDLASLSDLQLHFLSLHLAFPSCLFRRYLPFENFTGAELVIRVSEKNPEKKNLKNLLFGLRCRLTDLSPDFKFFSPHQFTFARSSVPDCASLPENFRAFTRPVPSAQEISDLPSKLVRAFEQTGVQPEISVPKISHNPQQAALQKLAEAEKAAEWRMHREFSLAHNLANVIDRIKSFLPALGVAGPQPTVDNPMRPSVDAPRGENVRPSVDASDTPRGENAAKVAIETWEKRLQEAEEAAQRGLSRQQEEHAREMKAARREAETLRDELKDERSRREQAEREWQKLERLLSKIKEGRIGNFTVKRGTRKFDI